MASLRAVAVNHCVDYLDFDQKWTRSHHRLIMAALNFGAYVCEKEEEQEEEERCYLMN
jgi:hypothetical protein